MIKTSGNVAKGFIHTSGKVADKMLAKGGDFAAGMMKLTAKLSDDVGIMADRILEMADRIGDMADRIERTEALMAKLTAVLADRDIDLTSTGSAGNTGGDSVVLHVNGTEATAHTGPELSITGGSANYLLYVSDSPLFRDGSTVISRIRNTDDYAAAWQRSIEVIKGSVKGGAENDGGPVTVAIAVKAEMENRRLSALSNSIDITVG